MPDKIKYRLYVWKEKPENLSSPYLGTEFWKATIENAQVLPRIGDTIESEDFDDAEEYRVFDVRHNISSLFSYLATESRSREIKFELTENENHLPRVLAYLIR